MNWLECIRNFVREANNHELLPVRIEAVPHLKDEYVKFIKTALVIFLLENMYKHQHFH